MWIVEADRFLTLAVTDLDRSNSGDHAAIADAALLTVEQLDLGDIAAGGDGYGAATDGLGLHIATGQIVDPDTFGGATSGGPLFTATDGTGGAVDFPLVDGVFLPNGTTQIRTDGSTFDFPATDGNNWDAIRNAAAHYGFTTPELQPIQLADQPGVDRRGLGIHANAGITFDLEAIRNTGHYVNQFTGVAGINFTAVDGPYADFTVWVLLDGEVRYEQSFSWDGLTYEAFSVPIMESDEFLTIATTDFNAWFHTDQAAIADATLRKIDLASCCLPGQVCQVLDEATCIDQGGYWLPNVPNCDDNPCAAIYYAPGEANAWDNTAPMIPQGDGTHHYEVVGFVDPSPATSLFDILSVAGDWGSTIYPFGFQWLTLDANGDNTLILDTNTYADGWMPETNRVKVAYEPATFWTAIGDWQSQIGGYDWDNANPNTAMTHEVDGIYYLDAALAPGDYEYQAVVTGTWDGIGTNSRNVNTDSLPFNVPGTGGVVNMWVDVIEGTIKVEVVPYCMAPGDSNCDGYVNSGDIDPFVIALTQDQADWEALYDCDFLCANDVNGDGFVTSGDIDPFVLLLGR